MADDAMRINHTKIDLAEKVVFKHAFKNVNRGCFSNLLWEIIAQS